MTYLTTKQIADFLCESPRYVQWLIRTGRLGCDRKRYGERTTYYPTPEELRAYLEVYEPAMLQKHKIVFGTGRLDGSSA